MTRPKNAGPNKHEVHRRAGGRPASCRDGAQYAGSLRRWLESHPRERKAARAVPRLAVVASGDRLACPYEISDDDIEQTRGLAGQMRHRLVPHEDLVQEGLLGRVVAMSRMWPGMRKPGGYATEYAKGRMRKAIWLARRAAWLIPESSLVRCHRHRTAYGLAASPAPCAPDAPPRDLRAELALLMLMLSSREHAVLLLRYGLDGGVPVTQDDLAWALNTGPSAIYAVERRAVRKLQAYARDVLAETASEV